MPVKNYIRIYSQNHKKEVRLGALIKEGGEGEIYTIDGLNSHIAKIYKKTERTTEEKLSAMLYGPPTDPTSKIGHYSIAWPEDILRDRSSNSVVGFIMPKIAGDSLYTVISPSQRQRLHEKNHFDKRALFVIARNLAACLEAIHAQGHVIRDLNPKNVLVNSKGLVTLVDCDSFQIREPTSGKFFPCLVGMEEYTAPESMAKKSGDIFTETEDAFVLAILFFSLFMEGTHPFAAVPLHPEDQTTISDRIANGQWPYAGGNYKPRPGSPPLDSLPEDVVDLFKTCFESGHKSADQRPTPRMWRKTLDTVISQLDKSTLKPKQNHFDTHSVSYSSGVKCKYPSIQHNTTFINYRNSKKIKLKQPFKERPQLAKAPKLNCVK